MIHILWPTVRPEMFVATYRQWIDKCVNPSLLTVSVAVRSCHHSEFIRGNANPLPTKIMVTGERSPGAAYPAFVLGRTLVGNPGDIVIGASDDFYPMDKWDEAIVREMQGHDGALLINDCFQQFVCPREYEARKPFFLSTPIMSYGTLQALNGIILHPAYHHNWSDVELMDNIVEMGRLKNIMYDKPEVYFEHRHHALKKRPRDEVDIETEKNDSNDNLTYVKRKRLSLAERLKV